MNLYNLDWRLQQIPGTTSEISVQRSTIVGTAKILQNPQAPRPLVEDRSLKETTPDNPQVDLVGRGNNTLSSHFIRYTLLVPGWIPICPVNSTHTH